MNEKQTSILIGGLVVTVLSTSYLGFINFVCCLGVLVGAIVTVWHYTSTNTVTISGGDGAKMGVLAALIGLVASAVINYVLALVGLDATAFVNQLVLDRFGDAMPPEQVAEIERQIADGPRISDVVTSLGVGSILYALFGAVGGVIGAALFKKGESDHA
ncbi:MAG: hypothetical protein AAFN13_17325 [Bacteroidota bacterium]